MADRYTKIGKTINCKVCNKEFYIKPSEYSTRKFCSVGCSYIGKNHKNLFVKGHKDLVTAGSRKIAGAEISKSLTGKKLSEEHRENLSLSHKNKYDSEYYRTIGLKGLMKQQSGFTSIEKILYEYLESKNLVFHKQHLINDKFLVDAFLPNQNTVIECDGDYWHSLDAVKKRDKAKNAYLTKCGFNLIRIPEHDIRNGAYVEYLRGVA